MISVRISLFAKLNNIIGTCSVFCCTSCYGNMEGITVRSATHSAWAGIVRFMNMDLELYFVPQDSSVAVLLLQSGCDSAKWARAEKLTPRFYPNCFSDWNKIHPEIKLVLSLMIPKKSCYPLCTCVQKHQFLGSTTHQVILPY